MVDVNTAQLADTLLDGKYQLGRIVGEGGMGIVFEGLDVRNEQKVAVKCLHPRLIDDSTAVKRFQQEARLAGALGSQENICEVVDFGTDDKGIPYLVMPLLLGVSLENLFQSRLLTLERLVEIVRQTLIALAVAHRESIVHRDLKPGNIFVTRTPAEGDLVKLLDFGISKVLDQETVLKLTRTGAILGTPHYMSPEQASGNTEIDHRTDIYAVGTILYEGLTGRCPFDGDSYNEIIAKIVSAPFVMPRRLNPLIPAGIEKVVLTAMARDPLRRYGDAASMAGALEAALSVADADTLSPITASVTATAGQDRGFGDVRPSSRKQNAESPALKARFSGAPAEARASRRRKKRVGLLLIGLLLTLLLASSALFVFWTTQNNRASSAAIVSPLQSVPTSTQGERQVSSPRAEAASHQEAAPNVTIPLTLPAENEGEIMVIPYRREAESSAHDSQRVAKGGRAASGSRSKEKKDEVQSTKVNRRVDTEPPETPSSTPVSKKEGLIKRGITFEDKYE